MKKFPLLVVLAVSFLYAQEDECACPPPPFGYNLPARISVCNSWDIYTDFSFLYWMSSQSNMEIGIVSDQSDQNYFLNGSIKKLDFNYDPGFQVGLGVNLSRDQWDIFLRYTWYKSRAYSSVSLNPNEFKLLYPSWELPDLYVAYFNGDEKWNVKLQYLDFELGKEYAVGLDLTYRPFIGIRGIRIHQQVSVNYDNVTNFILLPRYSVFVEQTSRSWGVGPRVGIETDWNLGAGFTLFGNGGVDLLFTEYTKIKISQRGRTVEGKTLEGSLVSVNVKDDKHLRAHFDLEMGLGYGTYFACRKGHFNLNLGYQFQVFLDQNMFRSFVDDQTLGKADAPHGNLYIHGLTATLRVDF